MLRTLLLNRRLPWQPKIVMAASDRLERGVPPIGGQRQRNNTAAAIGRESKDLGPASFRKVVPKSDEAGCWVALYDRVACAGDKWLGLRGAGPSAALPDRRTWKQHNGL